MEYLLEVSAIITIFYLCYKLFLQRDTFFEFNRAYLIVGIISSFLIPFIVIPIYVEYTPIDFSSYTTETFTMTESVKKPIESVDSILIIYLLGVIGFSIRFIIQFLSLTRIIIKNKHESKEGFEFVTTNKDISPFSFFKWIVYNPNLFNTEELNQIIEHEKVHVKQYHSIDNVITQLSSIVLWFNPFIWFYNKDLKQNLEFIADKNAIQNSDSKKNYQYTLLKTSMSTDQLALTNNFYNSLIKKRIIMLQKTKSKKINQLKYALIIPALALFLMSFNTEKVYLKAEKVDTNNQPTEKLLEQNDPIIIYITDSFTDEELKLLKSHLSTKGYSFKTSKLQRNKYKLITGITISINNKSTSADYSISSNTRIKPIKLELNNSENSISIGITSDKIAVGFPSQVDADNYGVLKKMSDINLKKPLYILNEKEITGKEFEELNPKSIKSVNVLKSESAIKEYGEKGKNGVIEITTKKNKKSRWTVKGKKNNVIYATKDTIYVNKKPDLLKKIKNKFKKQPLYILDGKEITKKEVDLLDEQTINTMSIAKGENAIKQFGKKGKNGVIEIKTRTLGAKNNPYVKIVKAKLYIVDGKEVKFENFNYENIKSMNVLKGKAAIKKYGDKGKNGVVEITTKK
jgi:beta-lactamase regulating signal transducer with metallopeptidase domain